MKSLRSVFSNRRRLLGLLLVMFVIASAFVGYVSQPQSLSSPVSGPNADSYGFRVLINGPEVATTFGYATLAENIPASTYTTSFGGRMVELEGYLTIQVDDTQTTSDRIARLALSFSGYVAASSFGDSRSSANIVLRVPQKNFTLAMQQLKVLGKVEAESTSSNDVTEQYVNLQAQLDSYKTEESVLIRILNSSTTVKDALDTENTIQNVQAQINEIEGQLRIMNRLVAFATINIQLIQPSKVPTLDFGDAFQSAVLAFYTVVKGMLILGASLTPIAALGGIIYYPYRRFSRRKTKPLEARSD